MRCAHACCDITESHRHTLTAQECNACDNGWHAWGPVKSSELADIYDPTGADSGSKGGSDA